MRAILFLLLATTLLQAQEEWKTTASGLEYRVIKEGRGRKPAKGDLAKVHYTGWLESGKKFDSSVDRGRPFPLTVGIGQVIKGWDEGLQLMTVGSKYRLRIPSALAYGVRGRPGIPPHSNLIFEVELLEVTKFSQADPDRQKTTESGLKYEIGRLGDGRAPRADEIVKVKYILWSTKGAHVISSITREEPMVGEVSKLGFPGRRLEFLSEVVGLMKRGGACRVEVPPALCFGNQRVGPLPAGATTVWDLELVDIIAFSKSDPQKLKKTASGLMYEVLVEGEGRSPGPRSQVRVHYTGWLLNGKRFDSSHARGQPSTFPLNGVIAGWTEGLQLMKEGATYKFTIPANLAYGAQAKRGIPPNSTLIFYVDLIAVIK